MRPVKSFYCRSLLLTLVATLWLTLSGCGSPADGDALVVRLSAPNGEEAETFLAGFERRELTLEGDKSAETIPWIPGSRAELKADAGQKITFSAYDELGRRRVGGEATVGEEKVVILPIDLL